MPAAAVIPAPTAYTNIAAVKTLVVDHRTWGCEVAYASGPEDGFGCSTACSSGNSTPRSMPPRSLHMGPIAPAISGLH